ncbi:hypothetical protein [Sphingomonas sp. PAMC 26621]|uniref:hypothetical protein n=1 Tax=Sphingomonas sp. PAMC 26621 TaxID=1112213 RepID=UPI000474ACB9|nr:hypothetical protein [Sphingomonas sp. PAMC 26621]
MKQVTADYLHTNEGSDPVLLETLGIKSDQSRGINDPGVAQAAKVSNDSSITRPAHLAISNAQAWNSLAQPAGAA